MGEGEFDHWGTNMDRLVDAFWIARYDYEPGWFIEPHAHEFYQVIYVVDGTGTASLDDQKMEVAEGCVLLLKPHVVHSLLADRGDRVRTIDTKFNVYGSRLVADLERIPSIVSDDAQRVRPILEQVRLEGLKARPWYRPLCNALMLQALITLLRESGGQEVSEPANIPLKFDDEAVRKAVMIIQRNFARELSLRDIADRVGYSPEYLSRRFCRRVGLSIHHYLMYYRIEQAKEMLTYSEVSVKEVAFNTGFKSIHHFTRAFKQFEGLPPATWRHQEREGIWKNVVIAPGFVNADITVTPKGPRPGTTRE
ncbi:MAG: AraC family transcriptional regulator [Spirochaetia bacterium]